MTNTKKRIILTGGAGLIGKEILQPLLDMQYEIFALDIKQGDNKEVHWINCNLFDENSLKKCFEEIKPTHLMNFAWATTGDYLTSNINFDFVKTGLNLLKYFQQNGGKRVVFAGTCFEYEFKNEKLKETDKINPQTTYAFCKDTLHKLAEEFCKNNQISFGYGRIFYVYGHNESPARFTSVIINNLLNNKPVTIYNGDLIKDYMYTKDIAGAFAKFIDSDVEGAVNICTGKEVSLKKFAGEFAKQLGKENLLDVRKEAINQSQIIVGDNTRLINEVGYKIRYNLQNAIENILQDNL